MRYLGSPPLARGTDSGHHRREQRPGITPACAGNRNMPGAKSPWRKDHPRLRGEQLSRDLSVPQSRGSPPLARGTVRSYASTVRDTGITPACAGNRTVAGWRTITRRDHPRLRGEQLFFFGIRQLLGGSPPLARGTAHRARGLIFAKRITPACAGNRKRCFSQMHLTGDHPRLRGEQDGGA